MEVLFIIAYIMLIAFTIEIATILLSMTGLTKEVSRYQVISMLTNTGFTTDEAKLIIDHPVRRKISAFLILFGAFSLAVIISAISAYLGDDLRLKQMGVILAVTVVVFLVLRTSFVKKRLEKRMQGRMAEKYEMDELPVKDALYLKESDFFTEIIFHEDSGFLDQTWEQAIEQGADIYPLTIKRGEEILRGQLDQQAIQLGDIWYVYGNKKSIYRQFKKELDEARHISEERKFLPAKKDK